MEYQAESNEYEEAERALEAIAEARRRVKVWASRYDKDSDTVVGFLMENMKHQAYKLERSAEYALECARSRNRDLIADIDAG